MMPLLTIIAVHYGPPEATHAYARALAELRGWDDLAQLIVVDNDGSLEEECEGAHVVTPPHNLGYLGGANEAINSLGTEAFGTWVAISNTDVRLANDFLLELNSLTERSSTVVPGAAILGPRLTEPGRGDVNPFLVARPSAARILAQRLAFAWHPVGRAYERAHKRKRSLLRRDSSESPIGVRQVYAVHGSLLVMSRDFALHQASLGYDGFLYGEEIHLAALAAHHGATTYHVSTLKAKHAMAQTMGEVGSAQRMAWRAESRRILWRTYFAPWRRRSG